MATLPQPQPTTTNNENEENTNVNGHTTPEQRGHLAPAGTEPRGNPRTQSAGGHPPNLGPQPNGRGGSSQNNVQLVNQQGILSVSSIGGSQTGGQALYLRSLCGKDHHGTSSGWGITHKHKYPIQMCFCDGPTNVLWCYDNSMTITSVTANYEHIYYQYLVAPDTLTPTITHYLASYNHRDIYANPVWIVGPEPRVEKALNLQWRLESGGEFTRIELEETWRLWNQDFNQLATNIGQQVALAAQSAAGSMELWQLWNLEYDRQVRQPIQQAENRKKDAGAAAERLLLSMLNHKQREQYLKLGYFDTEVNDHKYRISKHQNVRAVNKQGKEYISYCIHEAEVGCVPVADRLLGHKLLLEADEASFLRLANATHIG